MGVYLGGVVNGLVTFIPRIKAHGQGGHIVNVASMAAYLSGPRAGIYTASKFAVRGLTECLRFVPVAAPGCEAQFRTGNYPYDDRLRGRRFPLVDEERGLVLAFGFIDHPGRLAEYQLTDGRTVKSPVRRPQSFYLGELFRRARSSPGRRRLLTRTMVTLSPARARSALCSRCQATSPKQMIAAVPMQRMGERDEIDRAFLFLSSSQASFINGVDLFVDDGCVEL